MKQAITEFDIFYISYDEPKKEEYWAKLLDIAPWAKRVDGVKGFDSAHKACALQSETERFITVDGDNIVYPEFFNLELDIPPALEKCSLSWAGRNTINGLCYGNGGLKLWTKDFVLGMKTHENAETDAEKLDFCWDNRYVQMNNTYSDTSPNGSPFQAFRAGFREGVKMTLDRGQIVISGKIETALHSINYKRLLIWASIGADVENGIWAIYGTLLGIYKTNIEKNFDISQISDYDWFKKFFKDEIEHLDPVVESAKLLEPLKKTLSINISDMNAAQSEFFKSVYEPPRRTINPIVTEMEAKQ
jgi:hypothetical protein